MSQAIVACAIVHRKIKGVTQILLTKRSSSSDFLPGVYEIPGGHIEEGETLEAGLKRELLEELNLEIKVGDLFRAFTYSHNGKHTVELIYLATPTSDLNNIKIKADEIESCRWVNQHEIETIVAPTKQSGDPEIDIVKSVFDKLVN